MLFRSQFVGDDAFFRGVRRFYVQARFQKAGSDMLRQAMEAEAGRALGTFFDQWIYGDKLPKIAVTTSVEAAQSPGSSPTLVVRVSQLGDRFDLPVPLLVTYPGKKPVSVIVPISDLETETRVPLDGPVRKVELNRAAGVLAEFVKPRRP